MKFEWSWCRRQRLRGAAVPRPGCLSVALLVLLPGTGSAASVPWTPSVMARHAIELLVDDGGMPLTVTQWPLPRDAVEQAIDALPPGLSPALEDARDLVRSELRAQRSARVGTTLRGRRDAISGFGDDATPGSSLQLRSEELDGPHIAMQLGGRLDAVSDSGRSHATPRLDDSAVAVDAFGLQVQAWAHRSWWGPGWQSALPLSNNAPALDGIGLQRASDVPSRSPWLSWLGPWNIDFFLARTVGQAPGPGSNALISGTRLTIKPFSHLELGLTHMVQFGGQGLPEGLGAIARAVTGVHENVPEGSDERRDSGNGLGGYDIRVRCPDALRCAAYGQFMGEDDKKHLPYGFMNLVGTEIWSADGVSRFYLEATEISCRYQVVSLPRLGCAYRNHAYPYGYTAGDRWLGASVGPEARLVTLGWIDSDWDSSIRIDLGREGSRIGTFARPDDGSSTGRLMGISARRTWHLGGLSLTPEFDWSHVSSPVGPHVESRIGLEASMTLDDLGLASPGRLADEIAAAGHSTSSRLLVASALIGRSALFDRAADSYVKTNAHQPALKAMHDVGSALPYAEFGLAGAAWLVHHGDADGDVALAGIEAGVTSVAVAEVLKQAVDRSRPLENRGATDVGHERRSDSSFPSAHATLAWSVLTPFAERYDAPWLYGVAALTNVGRVAGRDHWLSDTVAGALLGYVVGDWFGHRAAGKSAPGETTLMLMPHGVAMSMALK